MVPKSTVALTDGKLISYLKLNIFEVFFVVISIRVKVEQEGGRWLRTLKMGREPQMVEKHCIRGLLGGNKLPPEVTTP